MDFWIGYSTPVQGDIGAGGFGCGVWLLDDASFEEVGAAMEYKGLKSGSTVYVDVWWAMVSAVAGNVTIAVGINAVASGESGVSAPATHTQILAVPGTANTMTKTTFILAEAYVPNDIIQVTCTRNSDAGTDTAVGDMKFVAATVRFA